MGAEEALLLKSSKGNQQNVEGCHLDGAHKLINMFPAAVTGDHGRKSSSELILTHVSKEYHHLPPEKDHILGTLCPSAHQVLQGGYRTSRKL